MRGRRLRRDRVYLAVAALAPMGLDFALTLLGQGPHYWSGERWVSETNPIWDALLQIHPAMFVVGVLAYAGFFTAGIYFGPRVVAWWLSILLLLTHVGGVHSWLWRFTAHIAVWEVILNGSMGVLACACFLLASRCTNEMALAERG